MSLDELNLSPAVTTKLVEAGLTTAEAVLAAGLVGLEAIDGIGPKTASEVLAAAQTATRTEADETKEAVVETPSPVSASMMEVADAEALVTVRNVSPDLVLVGERYLLPGEMRAVRRHLLRGVSQDKLEER